MQKGYYQEKIEPGDSLNMTLKTEVKDLELELTRLWEEKEGTGFVKGYLFNLILYSQEKDRTEDLKGLVQSFIEKFPCRIIHIQVEKNTPDDFLETDISNESSILGQACDQIFIRVAPALLNRVPFIIVPNLVPDLPVYLMWGHNPIHEEHVLPYLIKYADRLIFDSQYCEDLKHFAEKMLHVMDRMRIDFMDLTWGMISGWREALYHTFDSKNKIDLLNQAVQISISYNDRAIPHAHLQALFLQAWLAAQLQWNFQTHSLSNGVHTFSYSHDNQSCKITLNPRKENHLLPGSILNIQINTANHNRIAIERAEYHPKILIYFEDQEKCQMPFTLPLPTMSHSFSFAREIFYSKGIEHYQNMLNMLKNIMSEKDENPKRSTISIEKIKGFDERRDIIIPGNKQETIQFCVEHLIKIAQESILDHGYFSIALSGGNTPKAIYQMLSKPPYINQIEWDKVLLFWSDERNVPATHADSNYKMAMDAGFSSLPLKQENIFRMVAEDDIEENALKYEKTLIEKVPSRKLDLVTLGMGEDGHTASLFPKTHGLHSQDRLVIANFIPQQHTWRMTFTFKCINQAHHIAIYVLGKNKHHMFETIFSSQYVPDTFPIQRVGTPTNKALWILDSDARDA